MIRNRIITYNLLKVNNFIYKKSLTLNFKMSNMVRIRTNGVKMMIDFKKTILFNLRETTIHIAHYIHHNEKHAMEDNPFDGDRVSRLQGMAVGFLYVHDGQQVIQKDLEKGMSISKSTVSGLVKRMIKNGLIYTSPSSSDARVKCLNLTTYAIDIMNDINRQASETEEVLKKDISEEDLAIFFKVLKQIKQNAK